MLFLLKIKNFTGTEADIKLYFNKASVNELSIKKLGRINNNLEVVVYYLK